MVDSDGDSDEQWATAMAMATESATVMEMATAIAMATTTARATITKVWLPLHVPAMCSTLTGVTHCLHPHRHKEVCIHQRCVMGVTLQRVFAFFSRGRVPDSSPWIACFIYTSTVQFID
jgi:hypothetical protein